VLETSSEGGRRVPQISQPGSTMGTSTVPAAAPAAASTTVSIGRATAYLWAVASLAFLILLQLDSGLKSGGILASLGVPFFSSADSKTALTRSWTGNSAARSYASALMNGYFAKQLRQSDPGKAGKEGTAATKGEEKKEEKPAPAASASASPASAPKGEEKPAASGPSATATETPSAVPTPSSSPPPPPDYYKVAVSDIDLTTYQSKQYLIPQMILEGFGAWSDAVYETIDLAVKLNRVWVEPCVRNGCIEPCRCGRIRKVTRWTEELEAELDKTEAEDGVFVDPGMLPYIPDKCKLDIPPKDRPDDYVADAYPMSAYIDLEAIASEYDDGRIMSYEEWCTGFQQTWKPLEVEPKTKRWKYPKGYNFDMQTRYIVPEHPMAVGDFYFVKQAVGREPLKLEDGSEIKGLELLKFDKSPHMFLFSYYRAAFSLYYQYPAVPVGRWHQRAVKRFVDTQLSGPPFVAFHWRSEQVDPKQIYPCSKELVTISNAALPGFVNDEKPKAVLVSDMPAPSNPNRMWNDYVGGEDTDKHKAMGWMLTHGFRKYDSYAIGESKKLVDAGVLSLRDFLLSVTADWYISCQGDHWKDCHGCFRSGSNIVTRIYKERERRKIPFTLAWFRITYENAPAELRTHNGPPPAGNSTAVIAAAIARIPKKEEEKRL
jgi:hypothetical protein